MPRFLLFLLASMLFVLGSTACNTLSGPISPAEASRQFHARDAPESAPTFRVVATRPWERGAVVLYTYIRPARGQVPLLQMFGYDIVEPSDTGLWFTAGGGAGGTPPLPPAEELISYNSGSGWDRVRGDFSIVYGRVLAPQVASVEATFDNGQVLRDGRGDGFFVLITPARTAPCELRALDAKGQVLRRIDAASRAAPAKEFGMPEDNCPAASQK